jgi:hypothetical protein
MTVEINFDEPNVFPVVEDVDAHDNGETAAIFLGTRVEGQFVTVTINVTYEQAGDLAALLRDIVEFGRSSRQRLDPAMDGRKSEGTRPTRRVVQGSHRRRLLTSSAQAANDASRASIHSAKGSCQLSPFASA